MQEKKKSGPVCCGQNLRKLRFYRGVSYVALCLGIGGGLGWMGLGNNAYAAICFLPDCMDKMVEFKGDANTSTKFCTDNGYTYYELGQCPQYSIAEVCPSDSHYLKCDSTKWCTDNNYTTTADDCKAPKYADEQCPNGLKLYKQCKEDFTRACSEENHEYVSECLEGWQLDEENLCSYSPLYGICCNKCSDYPYEADEIPNGYQKAESCLACGDVTRYKKEPYNCANDGFKKCSNGPKTGSATCLSGTEVWYRECCIPCDDFPYFENTIPTGYLKGDSCDSCDGMKFKTKIGDCAEGYKWENGFCVPECDNVCEPGSVFYSDLSCCSQKSSSKTPIGVVAYVNGIKKYIINLNGYTQQIGEYDTKNISNISSVDSAKLDFAGKVKTYSSIQERGSNTNHAAGYCYNFITEGTNKGDWYLPAAGELYSSLSENKLAIGVGMKNSAGENLESWHASSSDALNGTIWNVNASTGEVESFDGVNDANIRCMLSLEWNEDDNNAQVCDSRYSFACRNYNDLSGYGTACGGLYTKCNCRYPAIWQVNACKCPSLYRFSCYGYNEAGGNGQPCDGKYTSCRCRSGYVWSGSSCVFQSCDSSYRYTCVGSGITGGSGTPCGGKYKSCTCKAFYAWNSSGYCVFQGCPTAYKYTCSGEGYEGGSGVDCQGKYSMCTCADGYEWKDGQCWLVGCTTDYKYTCETTDKITGGFGTACGGKYTKCSCQPGYTWLGEDCGCSTSYRYTCSGPGYMRGEGLACDGKYAKCVCDWDYVWDGSKCDCGPNFQYTCAPNSAAHVTGPLGGSCNGKYKNCQCEDGYYWDSGTCVCNPDYKYTCSMPHATGSGTACGGKYKSCTCESPYFWDMSKDICACDTSYKYTCSNEGENPEGTACNGKYQSCGCKSGYYKEDGVCVKKTSCDVGDILNSDMTCTITKESGKTPIGVVSYVDGNTAIAIELEDTPSLGPTVTNCPSLPDLNHDAALFDYNGKENTRKRVEYFPDASIADSGTHICYNNTTAGTSKGDWYLPASGELYQSIVDNNYKVNIGLQNAGGDEIIQGEDYWSSTEAKKEGVGDYPYAWMVTGGELNQRYDAGGNWHQQRCVIAFNDNKDGSATICNKDYVFRCSGTGYTGGNGESCGGMYKSCSCASGYEWKNKSCVSTQPKVGDILYSDMTWSAEFEGGKTPVGVVSYVNGSKRLAIQLDQSYHYWSPKTGLPSGIGVYQYNTEAKYDMRGQENTSAWMDFYSDYQNTNYAVGYCNNYKAPRTEIGDWYLPATGELYASIGTNYSAVNAGLSACGGKLIQSNDGYWSSSMQSSDMAWLVYANSSTISANHIVYAAYYVRCVLAF